MLKNRIQYLILLAFLIALYIFTNQYLPFILLLFFLILPAFSFIFLILSYANITVDFVIPSVIKKAEAGAIRFTLKNTSFFPVSGAVLCIEYRNDLTGEENRAKMFCAIRNKKANGISFSVSDIHSGQISVMLKKMNVCDILGLFSMPKKVLCEKRCLIYPDTYDVKIAMENLTEIGGDGEHYSQTKKGQDVNEIFALRGYAPGDEIRKIHWKLSAKQNKLIVRDFGLSLNYPIFLLLEAYDSNEDKSDESLDACMITFVSISRSLIENGICHNIAWYDSVSEKLIVKEIESVDVLEAYLPDLLSIHSYNEEAIALRFYEASNYRNIQLVLYYITTKMNSEEIAKRALYQTVKTIYITEEKGDTNDSYITTVAPRNVEADIENITI